MSGTNIPLFSRRKFDFSSADGSYIALRSVDVSQWTQGVLQVRVHADNPTSGSVQVKAYAIANTSEEPSVDYRDDTAVATATVDSSTTAPDLVIADLGSGFGGALQIEVAGASTPNNTPTLSAQLVMKD